MNLSAIDHFFLVCIFFLFIIIIILKFFFEENCSFQGIFCFFGKFPLPSVTISSTGRKHYPSAIPLLVLGE